MSLSKNLNSFAHIFPILDTAISNGEARMVFETSKDAFRWRAEAYHARRLLQQEESGRPTPYDRLVLLLQGTTIDIKQRASIGTLLVDGVKTTVTPLPMPDEQNPLMDEAQRLAKELFGE